MANYYLQDSGSNYWQIGITPLGQWNPSSVGAQTIVALVVQDSAGTYWQLGITTSGQLTWTSVGATTTTQMIVTDSQGQKWQVGVTINGQWAPQLLTYAGFITYIGA